MSLTMYSSSIPVINHYLNSLSALLKKAEDHAAEKKIDDSVFTSARLFPDMFTLSRQVQIASDTAKGCGARLAGVDNPQYEDTETTFAQLQERIQKTITFLESLSEESINGTEAKEIKIKAGPRELEFVGEHYLRNWVIPNLFFHITTAYNILRHNGVVIGKMDFLG